MMRWKSSCQYIVKFTSNVCMADCITSLFCVFFILLVLEEVFDSVYSSDTCYCTHFGLKKAGLHFFCRGPMEPQTGRRLKLETEPRGIEEIIPVSIIFIIHVH